MDKTAQLQVNMARDEKPGVSCCAGKGSEWKPKGTLNDNRSDVQKQDRSCVNRRYGQDISDENEKCKYRSSRFCRSDTGTIFFLISAGLFFCRLFRKPGNRLNASVIVQTQWHIMFNDPLPTAKTASGPCLHDNQFFLFYLTPDQFQQRNRHTHFASSKKFSLMVQMHKPVESLHQSANSQLHRFHFQ